MYSIPQVASLVDSDGSINIPISTSRYKARMEDNSGLEKAQFSFVINFRQVASMRNYVEDLINVLGCGSVYNHNNGSTSVTPMVSWQTTKAEDTLRVCKMLLPYLTFKKRAAEQMIEALELWFSTQGKRRGAGYEHPLWVKARIAQISSEMNVGQQKETSRRNKILRKQIIDDGS